ncbi:MAG: alpha/beta hydrolase, partial [Pirellulales bacterium]|nr:alpha/beta hydrolase [Pirellulales bacterium]
KLHGWYYPYEQARAVVLFCHGNAGNLSHRADLIRYLHDQHKLSVMIFDYRGYGRSDGVPDEQGILQDAFAARAWLARRAGIAEQDIVLMGRSLGGAVAVHLATVGNGARGLILESTFTSLPDVAETKVSSAASLMRSRLDSLSKIGHYHGPLLQSHGDEDSVIPYENGLKLFEAANKPKQFVTIHGADHNEVQSVEYYRALDRFLDTLPPTGPRPQMAAVPNYGPVQPRPR